jgi:hypothetical protein
LKSETLPVPRAKGKPLAAGPGTVKPSEPRKSTPPQPARPAPATKPTGQNDSNPLHL